MLDMAPALKENSRLGKLKLYVHFRVLPATPPHTHTNIVLYPTLYMAKLRRLNSINTRFLLLAIFIL